MLAVVEHQQRWPARELDPDPLGRRFPGPQPHIQPVGDRDGRIVAGAELAELDEDHAAVRAVLSGHPPRQAGLADATGTGQRHQPRGAQQVTDGGRLVAPADVTAEVGDVAAAVHHPPCAPYPRRNRQCRE